MNQFLLIFILCFTCDTGFSKQARNFFMPLIYDEVSKQIAPELRSTPVSRYSGEGIDFSEVIIFACSNVVNNRYLFNEDQNDFCLIKDPNDYKKIVKEIAVDLKGKFAGVHTVMFYNCNKKIEYVQHCYVDNLVIKSESKSLCIKEGQSTRCCFVADITGKNVKAVPCETEQEKKKNKKESSSTNKTIKQPVSTSRPSITIPNALLKPVSFETQEQNQQSEVEITNIQQ